MAEAQRQEIRDLLSVLHNALSPASSTSTGCITRAITIVAVLLEKTYLESLPEAGSPSPGWSNDLRSRFQGLAPESYLSISLTRAERMTLIDALVRLLDAPQWVAADAARALIDTDAIEAIPRIAAVVRRDVVSAPNVAWQAMVAMVRILFTSMLPSGCFSPEGKALTPVVVATLTFAVQNASQDTSPPLSDKAQQELETVQSILDSCSGD